MKEDYSYIILILVLIIIGFGVGYLYIKYMPPIKVIVINQPKSLGL